MNNSVRFFSRQNAINVINFNKILINTYLLLSSTIFFSAFVSFFTIKYNVKPISFFPMIIIYFGILFCINFFKKSFFGLFLVFILTGFLGYCASTLINRVLELRNGTELVIFSLFLTGFIFTTLSLYVIFTKKSFRFLNNFLFIGSVVILFCIIFNIFFHFKLMHLVMSGLIVIFSSICILYEISSILDGGEDDYILVTVSLYLSVYNIFLSLLNIFGIVSDSE